MLNNIENVMQKELAEPGIEPGSLTNCARSFCQRLVLTREAFISDRRVLTMRSGTDST